MQATCFELTTKTQQTRYIFKYKKCKKDFRAFFMPCLCSYVTQIQLPSFPCSLYTPELTVATFLVIALQIGKESLRDSQVSSDVWTKGVDRSFDVANGKKSYLSVSEVFPNT